MTRLCWFAVGFLCFVGSAGAIAKPPARFARNQLANVNCQLHGFILDFTANHGTDNRIWSEAMGCKRDLYVYLPPCYDGVRQYPLIIWLHGFSQDEEFFLKVAPKFDEAINCGRFPPVILAVPDGSLDGKPKAFAAGSFFLNSRAGKFEDYLMSDVWSFLFNNFAIRTEKQAHAFAGASMGGFSAFNLGIKYREHVYNVAGILPLLHLRYADCHGRRFADFDPDCQGWVEQYRPLAYSGRIMHVIPVFQGRAMRPLTARSTAREFISSENPVEMLDPWNVQPEQLEMFIGYGTRDSFNVDAQAQSFVYHAHQRGLNVHVACIPGGKHNRVTATKLFAPLAEWLGARLTPYAPPPCCGVRPITPMQIAPPTPHRIIAERFPLVPS